MSSNLPPSVRRQNWSDIILMAVMVFILSYSALINYTWHLGSNWGRLSDHLPYFIDALIDLSLYRSTDEWHHYWQSISEYHIQFFVHITLPLVSSLYLAFIVGRSFYYPGGQDRLRHISGARLYFYQSAAKHAKAQLKKELSEQHQQGLNIHPDIAITRARESGNVAVVGAQGTGKTMSIIPIMQQVIDRGERVFIYDEKREFTSLFYSSTNCILIAPWDARSQAWDISADANTASRAQLIAENIIVDSNDPLWSNGARMILVGMIEILNRTTSTWGWAELAQILSLDEVTLNKQLTQHYPRAARFIVENSKTTQSFFAQLLGSLGWIFTLAKAWPRAYENGFSINKWVEQVDTDKPIILVQADKRYKDIGAPLANTLIALMTANILSQCNDSKRELWLFIDELGNLPRNDALMEWMSLGRSKGCRIVMGTQSISQLKQLYTDHGADTLLNMFTLFISMRLGASGETSHYTAKTFGERQVERPNHTSNAQGQPMVNWHPETQALVTPSDLVQLPQASRKGVEGYLLIPSYQAVYRLRWPIAMLPSKAKEHYPAQWLSDTAKPVMTSTDQVLTRRDQLQARRDHHAINECDQ